MDETVEYFLVRERKIMNISRVCLQNRFDKKQKCSNVGAWAHFIWNEVKNNIVISEVINGVFYAEIKIYLHFILLYYYREHLYLSRDSNKSFAKQFARIITI